MKSTIKVLDMESNVINVGDTVEVPTPDNNDIWMYDFEGYVNEINEDYVIVEDGDGDCFSVEAYRLKIVKD